MHRLMWSLNDESGSIGWGVPEAVAEIMANHDGAAEKYAYILVCLRRTSRLTRFFGISPRMIRITSSATAILARKRASRVAPPR